MEIKLENKIKHCAKLLADSMLADEIKDVILAIINDLNEERLDQIILSLEREQAEIEKLASMIKEIDSSQDLKWQAIEKKQREKATQMLDEFMLNVVKNQIDQAK